MYQCKQKFGDPVIAPLAIKTFIYAKLLRESYMQLVA